jgi:hypothetical protein
MINGCNEALSCSNGTLLAVDDVMFFEINVHDNILLGLCITL